MAQISKDTFKFLKELAANNDREWFMANKPRYEEIRNAYVHFIGEMIDRIAVFDDSVAGLDPKKCVMRIYRDVRFSKDKTPYNVHISGHIVAGGRKNEHGRAGYYVRLEDGKSMLAGGAYLPPSPWMTAIRKEIETNADELRSIVGTASFKKYFGEIEGEKLKTAPKGYPRDHPEIELLRYKSLLAVHQCSNKQVMAADFVDYAQEVFHALHPFDAFLNRSGN
ncbi:MAG: DUF2461 domain-containing protein, partial [Chloroflexota bacterium]